MLCLLVLSCTILPSRPSTSLIKARRRRYVRNNLRSMLPFSSGRIAMRNAPKSTNKHLYCRNLDRRQSTRNVSVRSYRTVTVRTDYNVIVCLGGFGANRLHTKICVYVALWAHYSAPLQSGVWAWWWVLRTKIRLYVVLQAHYGTPQWRGSGRGDGCVRDTSCTCTREGCGQQGAEHT